MSLIVSTLNTLAAGLVISSLFGVAVSMFNIIDKGFEDPAAAQLGGQMLVIALFGLFLAVVFGGISLHFLNTRGR
jgi:hypothetical protein